MLVCPYCSAYSMQSDTYSAAYGTLRIVHSMQDRSKYEPLVVLLWLVAEEGARL